MKLEILAKRIYDEPSDDDGYRILVDRLWPRGVSKAKAKIDLWAKELTPSNELRKWFHAAPGRDEEFKKRYLKELHEREGSIDQILESLDQPKITLVSAVKDLETGHVPVLKTFLTQKTGQGPS